MAYVTEYEWIIGLFIKALILRIYSSMLANNEIISI